MNMYTYVENIMNVYIFLYGSVWNKRLDDNIYSMLTWDPGVRYTACPTIACQS